MLSIRLEHSRTVVLAACQKSALRDILHEAIAHVSMFSRCWIKGQVIHSVSEFQGVQLDVTIWFPSGHYCEDTLLDTLNNTIRQQEQIQGYYRESRYKLTNRESAPFRNPPEFHDYDGHTVSRCNLDNVKYVEMNRE